MPIRSPCLIVYRLLDGSHVLDHVRRYVRVFIRKSSVDRFGEFLQDRLQLGCVFVFRAIVFPNNISQSNE